jgi:hypothetical protein
MEFSNMSVLNKDISLFRNYSSNEPFTFNLLRFLKCNEFAIEVERIRAIDSKAERDKLKAELPCFTPSGLFYPIRKAENLVKHSGLIQFDIDSKGNANINDWETLRNELSKIPEIAFCSLSVSGHGVWGLVPISNPEKHKEHFSALCFEFQKIGLVLDTAPQNVASLRGYSFDQQSYYNHSARTFTKIHVDNVENVKANKLSLQHTSTHFKESEKTEYLINQIVTHKIDITANYSDWLAISSAFACEFGEAGRGYFHEVSQYYTGYKPAETDRQYTACLRNSKGFGIGIFYRACSDYGIFFKPMLLEHNT